MEPRAHSAFVSHSSKDAAAAAALVGALEAAGLTCWIAPRDVRPGAAWSEEIMRGITASRCFVLLLSGAANLSENVLREVERAAARGKAIYPVRIEDVRPSARLEYFISVHHWIDALDGLVTEQASRLADAMASGDTWAAGRAAPEPVEDLFTVPLRWDGPVLPPPRAGEAWAERVGDGLRSALDGAKLGEYSKHWSVPPILSWLTGDMLFLGGLQRVFAVDLRSQRVEPRFSVPLWRGRFIFDVACAPRGEHAAVCGNTFVRQMMSPKYDAEGYGHVREMDDHHNPDWGRVSWSPDGHTLLHTGLVKGSRSANWLKRFTAMADGDSHLYRFTFTRGRSMERVASYVLSGHHLGDRSVISWSSSGAFIGLSEWSWVCALPVETDADELSARGMAPDTELATGHMAWHPVRDIYACRTRGPGERDHGFAVVDAATRKVIHARQLERATPTQCIDWSPDGRRLALGGWDESILVWDFARDSAIRLLGHRSPVTTVRFSPDGQRLLSVGEGDGVRVWDPARASEPLLRAEGLIKHDYTQRLNGSPWSPDGRSFAVFAPSGRGRGRVMTLH